MTTLIATNVSSYLFRSHLGLSTVARSATTTSLSCDVVACRADVAELERRLTVRGTEKPEVVARRVEVGREEMRKADRYRHLVINREFERAVRDVCDILEQDTTF